MPGVASKKKSPVKKKVTGDKKKGKVKALPLSGSEPLFTEKRCGTPAGIRSNNCYDYAFDSFSTARNQKSGPGNRTGLNRGMGPIKSCGLLPKGVQTNNPSGVYKTNPEKVFRPGYFKAMMFISPSNGRNIFNSGDFHFYRQHGKVEYKIKPKDTAKKIATFFKIPVSRVTKANREKNKTNVFIPGKVIILKVNGFSHKRGWATGPLLKDASGKLIIDPRFSNNKYDGGLNYKKFCSAFCVRKNGEVVTGTPRNVNVNVKKNNVNNRIKKNRSIIENILGLR